MRTPPVDVVDDKPLRCPRAQCDTRPSAAGVTAPRRFRVRIPRSVIRSANSPASATFHPDNAAATRCRICVRLRPEARLPPYALTVRRGSAGPRNRTGTIRAVKEFRQVPQVWPQPRRTQGLDTNRSGAIIERRVESRVKSDLHVNEYNVTRAAVNVWSDNVGKTSIGRGVPSAALVPPTGRRITAPRGSHDRWSRGNRTNEVRWHRPRRPEAARWGG